MSALADELRHELQELRERSLLRSLRFAQSAQGTRMVVGGREVCAFCSNDYLGLASDRRVRQAAKEAVDRYGAGAGASRLVNASLEIHRELEERLAQFEGTEAALVFPSGYAANLGAICALVGRGDAIFVDRLNHASIIDGARLSGARLLPYKHCDPEHLEQLLRRYTGFRRRLVVTDGVFSMDGDIAPLPELVEVCRRHGAFLMVDEAHGTGVLGEGGRGAAEHFGLRGEIDVLMGTLSKAVGAQGGYIAGSRELIDTLVNRARAFVFTTAICPAACGAALEGLRIIEAEPERRRRLRENARLLRRLLGIATTGAEGEVPIIPVVLGEAQEALRASARLLERGFWVPAIRPPSVPRGTARLRITVCSEHRAEEIERLARALREIAAPR